MHPATLYFGPPTRTPSPPSRQGPVGTYGARTRDRPRLLAPPSVTGFGAL